LVCAYKIKYYPTQLLIAETLAVILLRTMRIYTIISLLILTGCSVKWADKVADKGHLKENINDYSKAMRHYNRAIRFNKQSVLAYWRRARVHYNNDKFDKSILDLDKGIQIDSAFNSGYGDRGNAKEMLEDYQGAINDYSTAIDFCEIEPNRPSTPKENFFYYRARAYQHIPDPIAAIKDLDSAIFYWDSFSRAIWMRAQIKTKLGRFDEAMADYKLDILDDHEAQYEDNADNFYYQGLCKFNTGDSTYCYDWGIAANYKFELAIRDLKKYCKK
jgi:tetratricopeptide (TPR) repeat protein